MPVTTSHENYDAMLPVWKRMRNCIAGEDAIKAAGATYLPLPEGRSNDAYRAYLHRASFNNATGKTVEGMVGGIFRKPTRVALPGALEYLLEDADGRGTPLDSLARLATHEVLGLGRLGILVDYPSVPEAKTLADERELGAAARLYLYSAEDIINWRYARVGSDYVLSMLVLFESVERVAPEDPFETQHIDTYRVLSLQDGLYVVQVYEEVDGAWTVTSSFEPKLAGGDRLNWIPFVFVGAADLTANVDKPPVADIAAVNLAHYRNSADYEDAVYMVGQPTPVINGLDDEFIEKHKGQLTIGSRSAWLLPEGADAKFLELSRDISAIASAMERKEKQMVALGARLIDQSAGGVEAAETVRLRQSGEASILSTISDNISRGLRLCLGWMALWVTGSDEGVEFEVNRDFFSGRTTPEEMKALIAAWQGGAITYETLFQQLVTGEVIDEDEDPDEYREKLDEEAPALPPPDFSEEADDGEDDEPPPEPEDPEAQDAA